MDRKSKNDLIKAIRSASKSIGAKGLSLTQFVEKSGFTKSDVSRHFATWSDACRAAGVEHDTSRDRRPGEELLKDWGRVARKVGKVPTLNEYKLYGEFSRNAFDRFGAWINVPDAFSKLFTGSDEWKDVLAILEQHPPKPTMPKTSRSGGRHLPAQTLEREVTGAQPDAQLKGLENRILQAVQEYGAAWQHRLEESEDLVESLQRDITELRRSKSITSIATDAEAKKLYASLCEKSDALGNSYMQIRQDVQDASRVSWAGTAHEIRQLLATLLETLAPDPSVTTQPWYKQDPNTHGPTRPQRVRYILQMHQAGSKEQAVVSKVTDLA